MTSTRIVKRLERFSRAVPLAPRVSILLIFALTSVLVTSGMFWFFLSVTGGMPELFDDMGRQRMLSTQLVVHAYQLDTQEPSDTGEIRGQLHQASNDFDETLNTFVGNLNRLPGERASIDGLTLEIIDLWDDFQPHIQLLVANEGSVDERRQAREYIIDQGPILSAKSADLVKGLRYQVDIARKRFWRVLQIAIFFTLSLVIAGYLLIQRQLVAPLQALEQSVRQMRGGRLSTRIESEHDDEIGQVQKAFNDMATEIEELVETLEERRQFAELLIIHTPAGVVLHRDREVIFANPRLLSLLEVEAIEAISDEHLSNFYPPTRHRDEGKAQSHVPKPATVEKLRLEGSGEAKSIEVVSVPIEYEGAQATLTMVRDVTEQEEITARLMLMDRVVAMGTLVAGVGHEINNPLSFVLANVDFSQRALSTLKENESDDAALNLLNEMEEALQDSRIGAERIRDIVDRLRTFARTDEAPGERVDIAQAIESAISMAQGELHEGAHMVKNFEKDIPPVLANETKLVQVFLNVLINAIHALDHGDGEEDTVTVNLLYRDEQVVIEICDTGGGIPEEVADRIFDPFFTTKPPGHGTGLGLSICQKIIKESKGVITFDSKADRGTTFRISLPALLES